MDIGTAKPTQQEMQGIVHHLLSVAEPDEDFSVSRYCEMATPVLDHILSQGKVAIIAGGTGFYMDSLIRGNTFAPYPATGRREELEALADRDGIEAVIAMLRKVDPDSADKLHPSDRKRIIRAMEVYLETGKSITQHNLQTQQLPPKHSPLWLGLEDQDRACLYRRIDLRVETMLEQGLLDEVRSLLNRGISEKCTSMQAIGYKEFVDALSGRCSVAEAVKAVQQASRHYAKRQLTWFRRNRNMHWIRRQENDTLEEIVLQARQILAESDN